MNGHAMLRRNFLSAAALTVLLGAAEARPWDKECPPTSNGAERRRKSLIQSYYSAWEKKEWRMLDSLLADDFTFTSPNDDDHINKAAFKRRCWPTAAWIVKFDLECVMVRENEGFAKYLLTTKDGKSLRNTEYFRFANEQIKDIEVYFGGKLGYAGQQT